MNKGIRINKLTTLGECELRLVGKKNNWYEKCICDCGNIVRVNRYHLTTNGRKVKSCGCLRNEVGKRNKEVTIKSNTTHNLSNSKIYNVYLSMIERCNNKKYKGYKSYGGRGIKCLWESFEEFYRDMGGGYKDGLSIDRIDVNGNYCKENCRWITMKEQSLNKRNSKKFDWKGKKLAIIEIIDLEGLSIDPRIVWWRLKHGWNIEKAVFTDSTLYHKNTKNE